MKKFTKALALVLAVLFVAGCFAACQSQDNKEEEKRTLTLATSADFLAKVL